MTRSGIAGTNTSGASVTIGSFPDNEPFNVAQINGVTPLMGNGATGTGALRVSLANDSTGVVIANGGVASGAADSGNPVKAGGKYNASPVTLTDGNRGDNQLDVNGYLKVNVAAGVGSDVADDAASSGNPVPIGALVKSPDGTDPGNVSAENDRSSLTSDLNRRLYTNTRHARSGHKHLNGSSAYTDESIVADPGDGFQVVITSIIASTGAATALNFFLEEGSTTIFGPIYLEAVAGRGFVSGPIHLPITASTAVTLTSSAAIAQSFDIDYFIQAV
jgi:hypothetical protein